MQTKPLRLLQMLKHHDFRPADLKPGVGSHDADPTRENGRISLLISHAENSAMSRFSNRYSHGPGARGRNRVDARIPERQERQRRTCSTPSLSNRGDPERDNITTANGIGRSMRHKTSYENVTVDVPMRWPAFTASERTPFVSSSPAPKHCLSGPQIIPDRRRASSPDPARTSASQRRA